jgi:hypothetical protein
MAEQTTKSANHKRDGGSLRNILTAPANLDYKGGSVNFLWDRLTQRHLS